MEKKSSECKCVYYYVSVLGRGLGFADLARVFLLSVLICFGGSEALCAADRPLSLGHIDFSTSVGGKAREDFVNGVLALDSMWYDKAREYFRAAESIDPSFGMAYWGEAMSYDDPFLIEENQDEEERAGESTVSRMDALDAKQLLHWDKRETGFRTAIRERFHAGSAREQRRMAYAVAMSQLAAKYPDDDEVTVFTALALMSLPNFDNTNPTDLVPVAGRLEQVFARNPKHPGALLLLIQIYASPTFALMGVRQARIYAEMVPPSVHAIHMPSHIFRLLGMWKEVESSNVDCWSVAVEQQKETGRPFRNRDLHCLDWLGDAISALNADDDARRLLVDLDGISKRNPGHDWDTFRKFVAGLRRDFTKKFPGLHAATSTPGG